MRHLWIGVWAIMASFLSTSCQKVAGLPNIKISGVIYTFPKDHVLGLRGAEDNGPFVYLKPPQRDFIIVYSQRVERLQRANSETPVISYLNEGNELEYSVLKSDSRVIICVPGDLKFRCGFRIKDKAVGWSILFDRGFEHDTARISREVTQLLEGYRS
jgi:hypothetical protein